MHDPICKAMLPVSDYLPAGHMLAGDASVRLLNPAIADAGEGLAAVYRIISTAGAREIHGCRLSATLDVVAGSPVDISALLRPLMASETEHSRQWFADPRLFPLGGRLYMSWNDGFHYVDGKVAPHNNQYLVELDADSLHPAGPVRPMRRDDGQWRPEKNWMLFADGAAWRCIYEASPHRILSLTEDGTDKLGWRERFATPNDAPYPARFGEIRGGAAPVERDGRFYHFAHSAWPVGAKRRYGALVYAFEAKPPYRVTRCAAEPLALPRPAAMPDLPTLNENADEVIYVTGAVHRSGAWVLSYGVDDKIGCITVVDTAAIDARLEPVAAPGWRRTTIVAAKSRLRRHRNRFRLLRQRLFG